jgi:hypothetical protein
MGGEFGGRPPGGGLAQAKGGGAPAGRGAGRGRAPPAARRARGALAPRPAALPFLSLSPSTPAPLQAGLSRGNASPAKSGEGGAPRARRTLAWHSSSTAATAAVTSSAKRRQRRYARPRGLRQLRAQRHAAPLDSVDALPPPLSIPLGPRRSAGSIDTGQGYKHQTTRTQEHRAGVAGHGSVHEEAGGKEATAKQAHVAACAEGVGPSGQSKRHARHTGNPRARQGWRCARQAEGLGVRAV